MEDTFLQQDGNASLLQQAINNYKKTPADRKNCDYIQKKIKDITILWENFQKLDNRIRSDQSVPEDHPYYQRKLYDIIRAKFNEISIKMEEDLRIAEKKNIMHASVEEPSKACSSGKALSVASSNTLYQRQKTVIHTVRKMIKNLIEEKDTQSVNYYKLKLKTIDQHWASAQQLHEKLWTSEDYYDFDQYIRDEEYINQGLFIIHERASTLKNETNPNGSAVNSGQIKLPKIELPTFNGDYVKWRQFRDLFIKMVHNQPLPLCQKLCYLQSSVQGEAARLIQHFTATEDNYEDAWLILNQRFENKRLLVGALQQRLLSQRPTQAECPSSIKALHDTTRECLLGLQGLGIPVDHWDAILVHILAKLLDNTTRRLWERSLTNPREIPKLTEFLEFLELHFQSEEALGSEKKRSYHNSSLIATTHNCIACKQLHGLYQCNKFISMTPKQRLQVVQGARLCVNCFKSDHKTNQCPSTKNCKTCEKRHNTLVHLDLNPKTQSTRQLKHTPAYEKLTQLPQINTKETQPALFACTTPASLTTLQKKGLGTSVLLSTIQIKITDEYGNEIICRGILDNGSQINFISQTLIKKLGLKGYKHHLNIQGIGHGPSLKVSERVNIRLTSCTTGFSSRIEAQILPKIVSAQPSQLINIENWNIPKNLQLADPEFNTPKEVDLLIGAGLFYSVLSVGQIKLGEGLPILQNTLFGWIVGGEFSNMSSLDQQLTCAMCTDDEVNATMVKFWEIEDCPTQEKMFTHAERKVENHFITTTRRGDDGRFIVRLPFQHDPSGLGNSYDIAVQRLKGTEKRITKYPNLREHYINFMREYEELGHMEEINLNTISGPHYFLPHHSVIKPDSTTTKLRVVFDASAKTSTNVSLNDLLATGPVIQEDVFTELIRFRLPRFVFTADIEKMYRQIWVHENDRHFQLILWREDPSQAIRCFKLKTITYGTSSAPYLAIRCLRQLAEQCKNQYPLAANAIENNFYVDDILTGSDNIQTAIKQQTELRELLTSAGLHLRKWCANDQRLLRNIKPEDQEVSLSLNNHEIDCIKTMGLTWRPKEDVFTIETKIESSHRVTKRIALSDISRMFDPLGFLAPVTIKAKIFLQQLWKLKLDWDASLPQDLHTEWLHFRMQFAQLRQIKISRHVFGHEMPLKREIHIFADASEKAYGAVSYVRSITKCNLVIIRLLCAKSRVAPTKQLSLPRLELCAAKLAADLMRRIQRDLKIDTQHFHLWSDSTAVLGWIKSESSNFHTFVANRISSIQRTTIVRQWHHVSSQDNPADMLSRGLNPTQLVENNHWFYGPRFLHSSMDTWTNNDLNVDQCTLEQKNKSITKLTSNIATAKDDAKCYIFDGKNRTRCFLGSLFFT